ncbi:MAG: DEAD/DEAH box helicase, partial [Myxococcales bacterium]|nr:DEAD/DEAH box helicase [Myxococcales bacterium]
MAARLSECAQRRAPRGGFHEHAARLSESIVSVSRNRRHAPSAHRARPAPPTLASIAAFRAALGDVSASPREPASPRAPASPSEPASPREQSVPFTRAPNATSQREPASPREQRFSTPRSSTPRSSTPRSTSPRTPSVAPARGPVDASAFEALGLVPPLVRAVGDEGYSVPTEIQVQAIPPVLAERDLLGCAQTGTGKTAAFVLPILQLLSGRVGNGRIRALVLSPTRELAAQIGERTGAYGRHLGVRHTIVYGGVSQRRQEIELKDKPEILIATPGRLLDLINQRIIALDAVEILVLDEADRMLDMGFLPDVRRIVARVPAVRQTLLFSATMPREIMGLAQSILRDPVHISVSPAVTTAETVAQAVYFVEKADKRSLLRGLLEREAIARVLVFSRTKHGADRIAKDLVRSGVDAAA